MKLRTAVPSGNWASIKVAAPAGGAVEGAMNKVQDTVGMYMQAETVGVDVAFLYRAEKIMLPKVVGTGLTFTAGQKVYYDATEKKVTPTAGSNLWVGIAREDATATATEVEVDFMGNKAT